MGVFNNFPYANFHELNADWIIEQVRKVMDDWEEYKTNMDLWKLGVDDQLAEFQAWFDNLDVQDEVRTVMNELILSGEFIEITSPQIVSATEAWLAAHITPTTPAVDDTLSISGAAADAKVTGDRITDLKEDINYIYDDVYGTTPFDIVQGGINDSTGSTSTSENFIRSTEISVEPETIYKVIVSNGKNEQLGFKAYYYDSTDTFLSVAAIGFATVGTTEWRFTTPANTKYVRFRLAYKVVSTITPDNVTVTATEQSAWRNSTVTDMGIISTSGTDLNNYINAGMWTLTDLTNIPNNYPSQALGKILVFSTPSNSSTETVQIVADNAGYMYYRISPSNGNWREWVTIANTVGVEAIKNNTVFNYGNISTTGLDLNKGNFIHPGMWTITSLSNIPYHYPSAKRGRIISFASSSDNTIYTYQVVVDDANVVYKRFSTNTSVWSPWTCENPYSKLAYKPTNPVCSFEASKHTQADTENYTMIWGSWENRVSRLLAMYDGESNPNGYTISKTSLGKDATNAFDVWLYKVSLGYTNQTNKPIVLLVVGEHGNEPASAMTGYYAYKEILNGALSKYLTYVDFWIVPLMNPYGYEHNIRNNGNDVNLNRDFPANWNYSTDSHNKTDNYSMSQPETNYIINLCLQNRDRILFVCNKHDTGAISRKIGQNEVDTVGYLTTCLYTDAFINEAICKYEDQQVKETDPYIVTACTADISKKQLIVNNSPHPLDGSLDLFLNSIGVHASLLEGSYGWNDGTTYVYYDGDVYNNVNYATSQIRYITDFFVNYIAWTIQHSEYLQSSDRAYAEYKLKSRKYNETTETWDNIELWYNGTSIVEIE